MNREEALAYLGENVLFSQTLSWEIERLGRNAAARAVPVPKALVFES